MVRTSQIDLSYTRPCKQAMQKYLKKCYHFSCLALNKNCWRASCVGRLIQGPSSKLRWQELGVGAQGKNLSDRFIVHKAVQTGYAEMFEKRYHCLALNKNCWRASCAGRLIQGHSSKLRWLELGVGAQGKNHSDRFIVHKAVQTGYTEMFEKMISFFRSCPK